MTTSPAAEGRPVSDNTARFITRMKLRELARQRDRLRADYLALRAAADAAPSAAVRLRALYDGLRQITLAGSSLHPDVMNLEPLLAEADAGAADSAIVELWTGKLRDEVSRGLRRTEFVTVFGGAVEESARFAGAAETFADDVARTLSFVSDAPPPTDPASVLGEQEATCPDPLAGTVDVSQVTSILSELADDTEAAADLRAEAKAFAADATLATELADALRILLADVSSWAYDPAGVSWRGYRTRDRVRVRPDLPLTDAVLFRLASDALIDEMNREGKVANGRNRLRKLLDLNAPQVIIDNERRMLRKLGVDPDSDDDEGPRAGTVAAERGDARTRRRAHIPGGGGYGTYDSPDADLAVAAVNAEVVVARAAYPELPLFVVKADVAEFYPSLPHDVVLALLAKKGYPATFADFVRRFLAVPLPGGGVAKRGVPLGQQLSGVLAEMLMQEAEAFIAERADVVVVRMVDDIALLANDPELVSTAYEALREFLSACGLTLNPEKGGAVVVGGGTVPAGLPTSPPRWGLLALTPAGEWVIDESAYARFVATCREQFAREPSVLGRARVYNRQARYLASCVSPALTLGEAHVRAVANIARRFRNDYLDDGKGVVAALTDAVRERFGVAEAVPEGWVLWPETAGGLGVVDARLLLTLYEDADERPQASGAEPDWETEDEAFGELYTWASGERAPKEPDETPVTKVLTDDFIQRGATVSGGRQVSLTAYWRWVLSLYGPQILEAFGTYRFLITELVPLRLVGRERQG